MADNRQYTALEWVVKEINETLQESQRVLESYASDPQDVTQLRFCQTLIHQVYGSLRMVGFHGAAMLAEEIEELSQALLDNKISKPNEGLEVLMRAILQLPHYLEKIQGTKRDYPAIVLSLLNDIRSVRGVNLLSESTLFTPNMSHAHVVMGTALPITRDHTQFKLLIGKLRKMYQYAAAGVANQVDVDKNYDYLLKVSDRLRKLLAGTKRYQIWHIAYAAVDGLSKECIESTAGTRNLLRALDTEIKQLQQGGTEALNEFSDETVIKNLLYYISAAEPSTPAIDTIKSWYELDQMLPLAQVTNEQDDLLGIDSATLNAVATAIREEFYEIKLKLDLCLQGDDSDENLLAVKTGMQRVNDTLAILGVGELRRMVSDSVVAIDLLRHQNGSLTNDQLMSFAHQLVNIESSLDSSLSIAGTGSANTYHLDEAQQAVLEECRNGLEKSKDAIVDYIATQWDIEQLRLVPQYMRAVRGNLAVLSLTKASDVLSCCILYIESQLIGQGVKPQWQQLDSLADVIASVDYYIEFMSAARENDESILDKAISGLALLGVSLGDVESISEDSVIELEDFRGSRVNAGEPYENQEILLETDVQGTIDDAASPLNYAEGFIDDELIGIFADEIEEIDETLDEYFPVWAQDFTNEEALIEVRRAFHTIKGSGRMVKAVDVGELGWSVENLLNRIMDKTLEPNEAQTTLITKVREILPDMVAAFKGHHVNPHQELSEQYISWAACLAKNEDVDEILQALSASSMADSNVENAVELERDIDANAVDIEEEIDEQLWAIFHAEAEGHIDVVEEYIQRMDAARPFYEPPGDLMQRALHTLKGSAYMADLTSIAELMKPLEQFAKELRSYQVNIDDDIFQLIKDGMLYTKEALLDISQLIYPTIAKHDQFLARIDELRERSVGPLIRQKEAEKAEQKVDPAVLEVLMAEEMHLLLDADLMIEQWQKTPAATSDWQPLHDELATLCHGAERANLKPMAHLSSALQGVYSQFINDEVEANPDNYATLLLGHNELMNTIDAIAAGQDLPQPNEELLQSLQSLPKINPISEPLNDQNNDVTADGADIFVDDLRVEDIKVDDTKVENIKLEAISQASTQLLEDNDTFNTEALSLEDLDEDIIEIFLEEAHELLEDLDESIGGWDNGVVDRERNELMQRTLHTFKGGARLTGLVGLGDLSHNYETFLISHINDEHSDELLLQVNQYQDQMIRQVDHVEKLFNSPNGVVEELAVDQPNAAITDSNVEPGSSVNENKPPMGIGLKEVAKANANVVPFTGKESPLTILKEVTGASVSQASMVNDAAAARRNQPQEMVKVSADLMEELVNLAGETSISRGRMEEQVSELGYSLDEMGSTVQRLQEQIRRLDIETEAQVIFRQEQMTETEDFDPLEMDRYSQLQQLSRSLTESASDLMDLKGTLSDKTRDAETVLLQQSRINTDLQEGLMRSRMVPFSRIVPRLRRIVRQISTELNKSVDLELGNTEGELDRSMMERMVAPLEHMLRNAIDHGIEDLATREGAGKASTGRIVISLDRDGSDVLVLVADDGAGIDINRVRQKAIERNLIRSNTDLSDKEILQFILHAGFSTAETITQISGRGVGMDVVNSEIRLMGGSIAINSQLGEGTVFTIRVPFTVSVNRALMINMGEDRYAIPLNTIEGIVRVSPFELEHYYAHPNELFQYANQEYQLRHLSTLLDNAAPAPRMEGHTLPLPVILVRSTDHSVAFQVDNLQGSREIVVKSLGPQFKSVLGVSGATIMGDGRVVVILDPNALIRSSLSRNLIDSENTELIAAEKLVEKNPLVMVVDDSVTVRKVTTRLLEREGYDVITAKDGVDAIGVLQDHQPDIMLLDIEMPRMDGFEVAKRVRSSQRHQDLPIIMITSRTGEKHRQRGLEAGANLYMGKPYQEEALLESIRGLVEHEHLNS